MNDSSVVIHDLKIIFQNGDSQQQVKRLKSLYAEVNYGDKYSDVNQEILLDKIGTILKARSV